MLDAASIIGPFASNFRSVIFVSEVIVKTQTAGKVAIPISLMNAPESSSIHLQYWIILISIRPASTVLPQGVTLRTASVSGRTFLVCCDLTLLYDSFHQRFSWKANP